MTRKSVSQLALAFSLFLSVGFSGWIAVQQAFGQTENPPTEHYSWAKPTYGTPVDHYVVQMLVNDVDTVSLGTVTVAELESTVPSLPV